MANEQQKKAEVTEKFPRPTPQSRIEAPTPETIKSPEPSEPKLPDFKRLGNNGETETWTAVPVTLEEDVSGRLKKGDKVFLVSSGDGRRGATPFTKAEYEAEKALFEATEKFSKGKAWDIITSLLVEHKEESEEYTKLDKYLKENKGRILEFAALMHRDEKLSYEAAAQLAKSEVKAVALKDIGKDYFEIDYSTIARALNEVTRDHLMYERGTEDSQAVARKECEKVINAGFKAVQFGGTKPTEIITATIPVTASMVSNERIWNILVHGETTVSSAKTSKKLSLETIQSNFLHDLYFATSYIDNVPLSIKELQFNEQILLDDLNALRNAERDAVLQATNDVGPAWQEFKAKSAKAQAKKKSLATPIPVMIEEYDVNNTPEVVETIDKPSSFHEQVTRQYNPDANITPVAPRTIKQQLANMPEAIEDEVTSDITPEEGAARLKKSEEKLGIVEARARKIRARREVTKKQAETKIVSDAILASERRTAANKIEMPRAIKSNITPEQLAAMHPDLAPAREAQPTKPEVKPTPAKTMATTRSAMKAEARTGGGSSGASEEALKRNPLRKLINKFWTAIGVEVDNTF